MISECVNLLNFNHPNLMSLVTCHISPSLMFFVTDLATKGTLRSCILSDQLNLSLDNRLLSMLCGAAKGLHVLHSRDEPIIHRDIKPDNILVREDYSAIVSDFGESKTLQDDVNSISTIVGTPFYIAPEIIRAEESTVQSDIFSFGILILVVSTFYHYRMRFTREFCKLKEIPTINPCRRKMDPVRICFQYKNEGTTVAEISSKVTQGFRPTLPEPFVRSWPELAALIQDCWIDDPNKRPTSLELRSRLDEINHMITGDEEDYLGIPTFPLRKYMLTQVLRLFHYERARDHDKASTHFKLETNYQTYMDSWGFIDHNAFDRQLHSGGCGKGNFDHLTAKEFFKREAIALKLGKHDTYWKFLDGWTRIILLKFNFPYPMEQRSDIRIGFRIFLDDKHMLNMTYSTKYIPPSIQKYFNLDKAIHETNYTVQKSFTSACGVRAEFLVDQTEEGKNKNILFDVYQSLDMGISVKLFANVMIKVGLKNYSNNFMGLPLLLEDDVRTGKQSIDPKYNRMNWTGETHNTEYLIPQWPLFCGKVEPLGVPDMMIGSQKEIMKRWAKVKIPDKIRRRRSSVSKLLRSFSIGSFGSSIRSDRSSPRTKRRTMFVATKSTMSSVPETMVQKTTMSSLSETSVSDSDGIFARQVASEE